MVTFAEISAKRVYTTNNNMRITKFFAPAAMLFALFLSSCTSSDVSDTTTPDCAITVVTVGTLSRDYTTTLESGADTTYTITVPGLSYPMHIDQINRIIYNTDSLPLGTRVNKVYFSAFTADGTIAYRTASGKDTLFSRKIRWTSPTREFSRFMRLTARETALTQYQ